ncbi:MAG: ABC transporter [Propionibacteriaceae bacterium]|jgi:energy-coupling factor transporter ATP-binding protein EcfA2|nr:ABC transporter [Propionibacteriaceae bacterium]
METHQLDSALAKLRAALAGIRLPLHLPSAVAADDYARRQLAQLDDYILPRLAEQNAPLLAVVGGSTGAGKSTLVNSLVGRVVSPSSVLRPTTRVPILVHNPADLHWFDSDRILPGLARNRDEEDGNTLRLAAEPALPEGLAILDAPDIDSVVTENRQLATQLLAAADLWIFLTTAVRYADAVPWDHLRHAAERNAMVAVVLDRVPATATREVSGYLAEMLRQRGLGSSKLFCIPETELDGDGLLPPALVAEINGWLAELAGNAAARRRAVAQTLGGAIEAMSRNVPKVVSALNEQEVSLASLREMANKAYREANVRIAEQTANGTMLRGEVLARWHDFVGTGQFFRAVEQKIGTLRDRITAFFSGTSKQAVQVGNAIEAGLDILIRQEAEAAAGRVHDAWDSDPAGREVIAGLDWNAGRGSAELPAAASELVRAWQADVLRMVSETAVPKRAQARYLALGINGVGVALMIFVFAHTGGLLGAELGVAGGTAVLAQRVLEAVFGEEAVRQLARNAKNNLDYRISELLNSEESRYDSLLDGLEVDSKIAVELANALVEIERSRHNDSRLAVDLVSEVR